VTSTGRTFIVEKKTFPGTTKDTNNNFWGRYYILSGMATSMGYPQGHTVLGTLSNATDADLSRFHFVGGSRAKLVAQLKTGSDQWTAKGGNDTQATNAFPVVKDDWQCWEFHVTPDDSFAFYINGTEVADMRVTKGKADSSGSSFPFSVFSQLQLGWEAFNGATAVTTWIDEVAVGPARIPCDK